MSETLDVTSTQDAKAKVGDVEVFGDGDTWRLLLKVCSKEQGWMKSTKVLEVPGMGCLVQVSTQRGGRVAEAVCFVPGAILQTDEDGALFIGGRP